MYKLCVIILFMTLLAGKPAAFAQCGTLSGSVLDADDKTPLEFASIYVKELERGVVSNEQGAYLIENICDGTYTLKIAHLGCETRELRVEVKGNTVKDLFLPHNMNVLKEVCIVQQRPEEKATQVKNELTGRDLEEAKGESLGEALKKIAGVTAIETGSSISKPVIHGLHSNRILVLNNGIRQEGQQWGSEHAPEIDPFIAGKLTVVKGANSVRYGSDAIAGVILVEPKPLRDSAGIGGELNLGASSNNRQGVISAITEQNFAKIPALSWRLQGTLKQAGNARTPDYWLKNTGFKEYNFSYAAGWNKENYGAELFYSQFNTTLGIFSGSHIGNLTDLQAAFNRTAPIEQAAFTYQIGRPYQHVEHELFKLRSFVNTGGIGKLSFIYARQYNLRYEYDKHKPLNDSLAELNRPELQYEITTHTADVLWEHDPIKGLNGTVGISAMTQGNTYEGRFFIPNYRNYSGGLFWIGRWRKGKTELEAGARYDYKWLQVFKYENKVLISPVHRFGNVSGTIGGIYRISPHVMLSANAGSAWRAPAVNELYSNGLHHGAASIEIGDRNLVPEEAYNFITSANFHNHKRLSGEVSVYYNTIRDFIYLEPVLPPVLTIRGAFPTFHYRQVDAAFKGIDLFISYAILPGLKLSSKASLLRALNKTIEDYLILMPSDRYENQLTYEFKNWKNLRDPYLSVSVLSVTKQWRVPENSDFAAPPEGYSLLNADAGFSFNIGRQTVEAGLSGSNLLNTAYRDYLNRFRYYSDAMGRNITLRLKIPF